MTRQAVDGLIATHADLQAVLEGLTDAQWQLPSACAGWRVQDVLAHVTSNFNEMVAPSPPPAEPAPTLTAEEAMEALVAPRKAWSAADLLAEYARTRDGAFAALAAMQDEPLASTEIPVADLGTYAMHWLANAYCFDHYCHVRHDLLAPGGPLPDTLAPPDDLRLRPGIEWMLAGLPQMCGAALAPVTGPLRLELTGPGGGVWTIHPPADGGLATIEESSSTPPVATVSSSAHDFVSWGTKRSDWRSACSLRGDGDVAAAFLDALNIV